VKYRERRRRERDRIERSIETKGECREQNEVYRAREEGERQNRAKYRERWRGGEDRIQRMIESEGEGRETVPTYTLRTFA